CTTLSKAPEISRYSINATIFRLFAQIDSGKSFLCSASSNILLATIASSTFASVLSRAIGLYTLAFV
ncbi:hypothetical protein M433DRAFT_161043, partial [Acidomyces richmondensis BFW]